MEHEAASAAHELWALVAFVSDSTVFVLAGLIAYTKVPELEFSCGK